MASVQVSAKVIVETRLEVLTITIKEFLKAFGAGEDCLKKVDKGVYQEQLLETITLKYYSKGEFRGRVKLHINWETYNVEVTKEDDQEFSFSKDTSILEQLDKASNVIIRHVNKLRKDLNIDTIECRYFYVNDVYADEEKLQKAREKLGLKPSNDSGDEETSPEFKTHIRFVMDKLRELEISVDN